MTDKATIDRWLSNRQNEIDGATLYHTLAAAESQPHLVELYQRLAKSEEDHAAFWEEKLRLAGAQLPPGRASFRARTLAWLARKFGPSFVLPTLATREQLDRNGYDNQPEAREANLSSAENSHARLLSTLAGNQPSGMEGGTLARMEGRHRSIGGNALRAAVLG
ncbi:MAG TPA: rubrerythrin family protein, partial [Armatimonadota bacterium]|nr:rubrerythrin family protein [Armatimonadota bacterium]